MSETPSLSVTEVLPLRSANGEERLHGLDWLRAAATVLVVLLHAGIPYLTHPLPGLVWATESTQRSGSVDLLCWWINGFIMPLFFVMSGYLASQLRLRLGLRGFLQHRVTRIGGPFLVGGVLVLPLDLYVWLLGWVNAEWIVPKKLQSLKVDPPLGDSLWGVGHLWFLEYLMLYCLCGWALCSLVERIRGATSSGRLRNALVTQENRVLRPSRQRRSFLGFDGLSCILLAGIAICSAILWWQPRIVIGFRHAWLPLWENALYYAVPFTLGWFLHHSQKQAVSWKRGALGLIAATGLFVLMLPRLRQHVLQEAFPVSDPWLPLLFAAFGLLMSLNLFRVALAVRCGPPPGTVRYLCEASFWIYLIHHPLVALAHVDLALVDWPPLWEFLISAVVALLLSLLSYEVFVRRTSLGMLMNGRRVHRPSSVPAPALIPPSNTEQPADASIVTTRAA